MISKMSHNQDPECDTRAGTPENMKDFRFMTVTKTFKQMLASPRVDCLIMTRETFEDIKAYIKKEDLGDLTYQADPASPLVKLTGMRIYIHRWLGDLIIYGDSTNKTMRQIIETCENRRDDPYLQGIKIEEVIR